MATEDTTSRDTVGGTGVTTLPVDMEHLVVTVVAAVTAVAEVTMLPLVATITLLPEVTGE